MQELHNRLKTLFFLLLSLKSLWHFKYQKHFQKFQNFEMCLLHNISKVFQWIINFETPLFFLNFKNHFKFQILLSFIFNNNIRGGEGYTDVNLRIEIGKSKSFAVRWEALVWIVCCLVYIIICHLARTYKSHSRCNNKQSTLLNQINKLKHASVKS